MAIWVMAYNGPILDALGGWADRELQLALGFYIKCRSVCLRLAPLHFCLNAAAQVAFRLFSLHHVSWDWDSS